MKTKLTALFLILLSFTSTASVFPNPMTEKATFSILSSEKLLPAEVKIMNEQGEVVRLFTMQEQSTLFLRENLLAGIYFYVINSKRSPHVIGKGKFMIE
jgi:hypothetical protein